jgi:hypothetical protein
VRLAAEVWRTRYAQLKDDLFPALRQAGIADLLLGRLADLGDEGLAAPFVEMLYGPHGECSDIDSLDGSDVSRYLGILAEAAPHAVLRNLRRIFANVTPERLCQFNTNRHQVIEVLRRLLHFEDTFFDAANLLCHFAEAEDEPQFQGTATRLWCSVFQTYLPIGPIPPVERHRLLGEALESYSVKTRLLAVRGILTALHPMLESRAVGVEVGGHILPKHWELETWGHLWEICRSAFTYLDRALNDSVVEVAEAARRTLLQAAAELVRINLADDILPKLAKQVPLAHTEAAKKELYSVFDVLLTHHEKMLSDEQRTFVRQLSEQTLGDNFRDRLYRWIGKLSHADRHA